MAKRVMLASLCAVLLIVIGRAAAAPDALVVIESAELRAQPVEGAASRGRIAEGTGVRRLDRSGGWIRVATADDAASGWLRIWQVRAAENGGDNPLLQGLKRFSRSIAGLFRTDDSGIRQTEITATIGVRGLDAGDFEEAAPAPGALQRVRALRADRAEAAAFARGAGLERRELAVLESHESRDWGEW